jgi:hypothetical protein
MYCIDYSHRASVQAGFWVFGRFETLPVKRQDPYTGYVPFTRRTYCWFFFVVGRPSYCLVGR